MNKPLLNPITQKQLLAYIKQPSPHGIMLTGPSGSGKTIVANWLAAKLLGISIDKINSCPYFMLIEPEQKQVLKIEEIRKINHFLSRKVPNLNQPVNRVLLIKNAEAMSLPAQNALLKNLEEPPLNTIIILTASDFSHILATIRSRCIKINILKPSHADLLNYLINQGYDHKLIERATSVSGDLPKLSIKLLDDQSGSINTATDTARDLLTTDRYHRLLRLNELAKDKDGFKDVLDILKRMAIVAMAKSSSETQFDRWNRILQLTLQSETFSKHNTNTKLNILNLLNRL